MARGLTPTEIIEAFRYWHVPYNEVDGWKTRSNGGSWNGVTGCMFHHTAMDASDAVNVRVLVNGRPDLRGPLCNFGGGDDGVIDIISAGPANHAGKGDPDVLRMVQTENYTGDIHPDQNSGSPGAIGGNSRFYGWEVYYGVGTDKTIDAIQYRAVVLSMAAIIWALDRVDGPSVKWSSKSAIGHKEWTNWKPDPAGVDMSDARDDIQWCLTHGPDLAYAWYKTGAKTSTGGSSAPTPKPPAPKPVATPVDLDVDGKFGPLTKKAFQRLTGIPQTGSWDLRTRRTAQKWCNRPVDGSWSTTDTKALQKKIGTKVDGDWGPLTTKALQRYLNAR